MNRDTLATQEKCLKVAADSLKAGKSVVVDNTNPSKAVRKPYTELAKKHGIPARCIYLDIPNELAVHLNYYRQNLSEGKQRRVPAVGYRVFDKGFSPPEKEEGFSEVLTINFVPHFESDTEKELFLHWQSTE